jgi:LysR family nitrogen assimilation transcriptional regulator
MTLDQLEAFVAVAEMGGYSRAAAALDRSQPTLSRLVRALEVEHRQAFFERNGRGVALTEAGRVLLAHGKGVLEQVDRTRQALEERRDSMVGKVVVGLPPTATRIAAAPLVLAFKRRFPTASISLVEGLSSVMQEWLLSGLVDLALVYESGESPLLRLLPLAEVPIVLIGRTIEPALHRGVGRADLRRLPLIMPRRPNAIRSAVEAACNRDGMRLEVAFEVDAIAAVLDLAFRGAGYAVLPEFSTRGEGETRRFATAPLRPAMTASIALAVPTQRPLTRLGAATADLIESAVAPLLTSKPPRVRGRPASAAPGRPARRAATP